MKYEISKTKQRHISGINAFNLFLAKLNQPFKYLNSQQMAMVVISLLTEM